MKLGFFGTLIAAFLLGLALTWSTAPVDASSLGLGRVTNVVPLDGGMVAQDSLPVTAVENWNVEQGKTYNVTLSGVTDAGNGGTDSSLEVIVKSSDTGNQCLSATNTGVGTYMFAVTLPANACHTYPILYGTVGCGPSTGLLARRSDGGAKESHLRAWDFVNGVEDTDCTSDPQGCSLVCPAPVEACNDSGVCSATLTVDQIGTPISTCPDGVTSTVTGVRSDGKDLTDPYPVGTTTITWTSTPSNGGLQSTCVQTVTVKDCEPPVITCPTDIVVQLHRRDVCPAVVTYTVTPTDNCGTVDVVTTPPSGSVFPFGTTTVTSVATDATGNTATCMFNVTVYTSVCGAKFYDANVDRVWDHSQEPPIEGWKVVLRGGGVTDPVIATQWTGVDGSYCFDGLLPGDYTVEEVFPSAMWKPTTVTAVSVTLDCPAEVNFGNVCLGAGGGLTLGFWSNKNGQAVMASCPGSLPLLVGLNLRNATGANFDPTLLATFRTWILGASATNMAYMLSAQLAAMELNVNCPSTFGGVSAGSIVWSQNLGFMTVSDLMAAANVSLGTNGYVLAGHPARAHQEDLKNALDDANNNRNFVQADPCPVVYP